MIDHDQRFKELLREFILEFLLLIYPNLARRLAGPVTDWQPQEVFTNPPLGLVRRIDLLAIVQMLVGKIIRDRVIHIEIESADSLTEVRKKIGYYYPSVRSKHNLPVVTLAVYLKVALEGLGWDEYIELDDVAEKEETEEAEEEEAEAEEAEEEAGPVYHVRWRYLGLPGLRAEDYLNSDNWLAVALWSLMRIEPERKLWLRAEILRRLALECHENDYRKLLLITCVETYLPLEGEQEAAYLKLVQNEPRYQEATKMILTTYDKGIAEGERLGKAKGKLEALQEVIIQLASPVCGEPDEATRKALSQIEDIARLKTLAQLATMATSWGQLLTS